jgi:hypothetical protein
MLGAQGLWAEKDLYRATSTVTRGLVFFPCLIGWTTQFSRLLRHKGKWRFYFNPDPQGFPVILHWINPDLYTNVFTLLVILISIPVTTGKAERSFSVMMRIKSYRSEIRNAHRVSGPAIFAWITFIHEFPWNLDLMLLIQRSFNIVCLLGGYGSSGVGFCPGKANTNLDIANALW